MKNPLYILYHDTEWGVPQHSDQKLFKLLILEGFRADLSWECVLNKREHFRRVYDAYTKKIDKLLLMYALRDLFNHRLF